MKPTVDNVERRDQIVAGLLWYGTWLASALIAAGIVLMEVDSAPAFLTLRLSGYGLVTAGIAVFILLPIARVALMIAVFLRARDYAYAAIAAFVLAIIAAGIIIEV